MYSGIIDRRLGRDEDDNKQSLGHRLNGFSLGARNNLQQDSDVESSAHSAVFRRQGETHDCNGTVGEELAGKGTGWEQGHQNEADTSFYSTNDGHSEKPSCFIYTLAVPKTGKLGITIGNKYMNGIIIETVKEFSPLYDLLQPGDEIVAIDGEDTTSLSRDEMVRLISIKRANANRSNQTMSLSVLSRSQKSGHLPDDRINFNMRTTFLGKTRVAWNDPNLTGILPEPAHYIDRFGRDRKSQEHSYFDSMTAFPYQEEDTTPLSHLMAPATDDES